MRRKIMRWETVLALIVTWLAWTPGCLAEEPVRDGAWNGKPWDREELDTGVREGDPEALAEYAYCSREGMNQVPYDAGRIFECASRSAAAGNAYGAAVASRCHLIGIGTEKNPQRGYELARESADAGHPLGMKNLANCLFYGDGTAADIKQAHRLNKRAIRLGCAIAGNNHANHQYDGSYGLPRDREKGIALSIENFREYRTLITALNLISRFVDDPEGEVYPLDLQKDVEARVREAHECGVPGTTIKLAKHLCMVGRGNEGVPLLIESCESSEAEAHELAADFAAGNSVAKTAGDRATISHLRREAVDLGCDSESVLNWVMDSYLYKYTDEPVAPEKALIHAQRLQEKGSAPPPHTMGRIFFSKQDSPVRDKRRGMAHYVYFSPESRNCAPFLAEALVSGRPEDHDYVHGYAAAVFALEHGMRSSDYYLKSLKERARKELDDAQFEEATDLIERGYPGADEFRRPAFEILKDYGDLPEDAEYE